MLGLHLHRHPLLHHYRSQGHRTNTWIASISVSCTGPVSSCGSSADKHGVLGQCYGDGPLILDDLNSTTTLYSHCPTQAMAQRRWDKSTNDEFRPWLAWSVPKFTHDGLNGLQNPPHYDTADWQGMDQETVRSRRDGS